MKKIVIIGAGQLGSRHLQGIAQSSFDISIEVVEPYESSRETAQIRYKEISSRNHVKSIEFYDSIEKLSSEIDLVIVATSSDVRAKVVTELLTTKKVSNLVLEKVLFQSIEEYYEVEKLLNETNTNCWINHPRRMFPIYKALREELKEAKQISYNFQGGNWGLGCNGLHFIDHLSYFANSLNLTVYNECLDKKIYDSKRKNFIEFNGLLTGMIDNHTFSLYSNAESSPSIFTIVSDVLVAKIDESNGIVNISKKENSWKWEIVEEKIVYFQSELSNILIEDILVKNKCFLPTYQEAMKLHIPYITCLLKHMDKITEKKHKICSIT